jgi:hypothetical protein
MKTNKSILSMIVTVLGVITISACQPNATETTEVRVTNITESEISTNEITQTKTINQCDSSSVFKTEVQFSDSSAQVNQQQLVLGLGGTGGGDLPNGVKLEITGSIEAHFSETLQQGQAHFESASIEVPAHTLQEYTIVWKETRHNGTVYYIENGEEKSTNYSYRVGLQLVSSSGKDLKCPEDLPQTLSQPFNLAGCGIASDCSEVKTLQGFFPSDTKFMQKDVIYPITVDSSQSFRLMIAWCALSQPLLEDNLKQIQFVLDIDGASYVDQYKLQYSSRVDDKNRTWNCYGGGVIFSDLALGTYNILYGLRHGTIFDGEVTYQAGDDSLSNFLVTVR